MKYLLLALLNLSVFGKVFSQCNQQLVEKAAALAGNDAVFIRDFKVKLSEATMQVPVPVAKYALVLNKGFTYRFTLEKDTTQKSIALLQLQQKSKTINSTYDPILPEYPKTFDFYCNQSATYEVILSFQEGQPGCAAGVLSMVVTDSLKIIEPNLSVYADTANKLYLFVKNQLNIAVTGVKGGRLEVETNNGKIVKEGYKYIYEPEYLGNSTLIIKVFNEYGELNEADTVQFEIEYPPLPDLILPGGLPFAIGKRQLRLNTKIDLLPYPDNDASPYQLVSFGLLKNYSDSQELMSNGDILTAQQINFILALNSGEIFYFTNLRFKDPEGKIHSLSHLAIVVNE